MAKSNVFGGSERSHPFIVHVGVDSLWADGRAARGRPLSRDRGSFCLQRRSLQRRGRPLYQGRNAHARAAASSLSGAIALQARTVRQGPRSVYADHERAAAGQLAAGISGRAVHRSREINAITPKIGSLEIKVEGAEAAKDLSIKVDGNPIASVLVGVPQPIDPGEHRIEASATGFRAQPQTVRLGDGEKVTTSLKLEPDPNAVPAAVAPGVTPAATAPGAPAAAGAPIRDTSVSMDSGTSPGSGMRIGAYTALGVGAVGLGLGTVFLLQAGSKRSDADGLCNLPNGGCPLTKKDEVDKLDSDAKSASTLSVVGFAVGGVGVAAGVVMLLLAGKSESTTASAQTIVYPWVGMGSGGVAGRF